MEEEKPEPLGVRFRVGFVDRAKRSFTSVMSSVLESELRRLVREGGMVVRGAMALWVMEGGENAVLVLARASAAAVRCIAVMVACSCCLFGCLGASVFRGFFCCGVMS